MNDVKEQLGIYARRAEEVLRSQLDRMQSACTGMDIDTLFAAMRHSLGAGGKRIRPALVYEFCRVCGGALEQADAAACAMEMTHTSSLIFDDLPAMDDDDLRRGKPSCHKAFGEATAILAGDALICAPFAVMAQAEGLDDAQKVELVRTLSVLEGESGMVGGQQMDMQFEERDDVTAAELETMCLGKTGALMAAACRMGVVCAGGSEAQREAAEEYGRLVGLAFQIIDDVLDVTSTAEQLGKPIGSDEESHKTTVVTLLGLDGARERAAALTAQAHGALDAFGDAQFLHDLTDLLLVRVQ